MTDGPPVDPPGCPGRRHGTYVAYQSYGCRCPDAREDWRLYAKRRRQGRAQPRLVDSTGTLRRIRALMRLGHASHTIAAAVGRISAHQIRELLKTLPHGGRVTIATEARIRRAYRALADQAGTSTHTRSRAERAGWPRPIDWDDDTIGDPAARPNTAPTDRTADEVAVARACAGRLPWQHLNDAERLAAYQRLAATGASYRRISRTLHVSEPKLREYLAA